MTSPHGRFLPKIILTDAEGLARNTDPALLILQITRREVESARYASVLERLHVLTDDAESLRRYQESLVFEVSGYENSPLELPEIPEVRRFFAHLTREWPHFIWYLLRGTGSIALLLALLCPVRIIRQRDGSFGTEFDDTRDIERTMLDLLHRGNALLAAYGVTPEEAEASAMSALKELTG